MPKPERFVPVGGKVSPGVSPRAASMARIIFRSLKAHIEKAHNSRIDANGPPGTNRVQTPMRI